MINYLKRKFKCFACGKLFSTGYDKYNHRYHCSKCLTVYNYFNTNKLRLVQYYINDDILVCDAVTRENYFIKNISKIIKNELKQAHKSALIYEIGENIEYLYNIEHDYIYPCGWWDINSWRYFSLLKEHLNIKNYEMIYSYKDAQNYLNKQTKLLNLK